ncbi:NfeD family protein [Salarchaeum sp. JOR-1]|uniref:NfeD family protein n=1 Tax=Salarchaeum sp. JOR-1 TaxID=2599399 RepID=UPI001198A9AB|nr:NfeD family protein [Salarchaeum sp. JOR-1]QDX39749.1 NfeD family protein [Salarchaeum sp. JOR-1]
MAVETLPLLLVIGGVALMVLEAFAPGAHFVVIGTALTVAGVLGILLPTVFATPIALAVVVLVVGGVSLWVYRRFDIYEGTDEGQTEGSASLRGKTGYVVERVTEREGRVKIEGGGFSSRYAARTRTGAIEEGTDIIVTDPGGGNVLTVESLDGRDDIDRELERERERQE